MIFLRVYLILIFYPGVFDMDYAALGKRVKMQRKLLNMTQEELAESAGISCSFLGHIERGTRKMSLETLVKIASSLKLSCDILLQDSIDQDILREAKGLNERKKRILSEIATVLRENDM
jgi:transcriptional regulator with XRE-family HTH domain